MTILEGLAWFFGLLGLILVGYTLAYKWVNR